ncbi:MAG: hypothetical protein ACFFCO_01725 [Promethearchaeota archaeon]
MSALEFEGTLSCFSALACLKDLPSKVQVGEHELEGECMVAAAVTDDVRVKLLASWVVWQVAMKRRCVILLERGRSATGLAEQLQILFPDLRVLVWAGPEAPPWPGPLEYDVVICSYRRFMNHFSRRTRCGFRAIAALNLDSLWLSKDCYLAEALIAQWRHAKHRIRLLGLTQGSAENLAKWLDASYIEVDPPKRINVIYVPLLDMDSLRDLDKGTQASKGKRALFTIQERREMWKEDLRRVDVDIPVYIYDQKLEKNSFNRVVVERQSLLSEIGKERLIAIAKILKEDGDLVVMYPANDSSEEDQERILQGTIRRLIRNTLNIGSLEDPPMDWEMLILHFFRRSLSLRQGFKLCRTSFSAQAGKRQHPSPEELEGMFQRLMDEELVQRHGTPKTRYEGSARCTEAGDALAKSIFSAADRRAAITRNFPRAQRSGEPRWTWVLRSAADLVRDEGLEREFADLLEKTPGEDPASKVPDWLYKGLFAIAAIDLETARFIEEHARQLYPHSFTDLRPPLYPKAKQRQSLTVALQKVLDHIHEILVIGKDDAGQLQLAPDAFFHYTKVAKKLGLSPIVVYNVFCDYLGSEQLTPIQVKTIKKLGENAWEQLRIIRFAMTLTQVLKGPQRPQLLLLRVHYPEGREPRMADRYQRTCGECAFFTPDSQLCAVWFHVAAVNERLVEGDRAERRQTSPKLHSCNYLVLKAKYEIPHDQLQTLKSPSTERDGLEKIPCLRRGCTGLLDGPPKVWKTVHCNRCGTIYRKSHQERIYSQEGFLDLLQERVHTITGALPKDLQIAVSPQSQGKAALFIDSSDTVVTVTTNQLVIEYRDGRFLEAYSYGEVGRLSLPAGQLGKENIRILKEKGVIVTLRPSHSSKEPNLSVARDLERIKEKGRATLFRRHCVANYLGLLHATVSLVEYLTARSVSRLLWLQIDRIYKFSHKTGSTLRKEKSLLRSCESQMAGLFHKAYRDILAPSGATHTEIGRARGRWVSYRGDPRLLARGWTPFDAALNLASRLLRWRLRKINANLGLGLQAPPLFLHTPSHTPGLGAHLDLEEQPRLALTLQVFRAFHSNRFALGDFHRYLTPLRVPYFVSTQSIYHKINRLVDSLLRQHTRYRGETQPLKVAHENHVKHLLDVLKTQNYDAYAPLVYMSPRMEEAWKTYEPLQAFAENLTVFGEHLRNVIQELLTQLR